MQHGDAGACQPHPRFAGLSQACRCSITVVITITIIMIIIVIVIGTILIWYIAYDSSIPMREL